MALAVKKIELTEFQIQIIRRLVTIQLNQDLDYLKEVTKIGDETAMVQTLKSSYAEREILALIAA